MSYTAPTVTASGTTFAQLKAGGLAGHLDRVIAAGSYSQAQINIVHRLMDPRPVSPVQSVSNHVSNYLRGDPIAYAEHAQRMLDYATAFSVMATAINEIATLHDANQGTIANGKRNFP